MSCISAVTTTSYEEPTLGSSSSRADAPPHLARQRRRHSYHHARRWSADAENIQFLVDQFLAELSRRLEFLETYGKNISLDAGFQSAYTTLASVRDACSNASDGVLDAGRKRAKVFVDTLDEQYQGALTRKESLEAKAQEGVRLMESLLSDFETRAYAIRDSRLQAAGEFLDESWKRVDKSLSSARHIVDDKLDQARRAKEALRAKIEAAIEAAKKQGVITYAELPEPWRVNPHILKGYRFSETKLDCVRSTLGLSNETVNIWSHFLGLIFVLAIAFYVFPASKTFERASHADLLIAGMFFFAAAKCLVCSTIWHTMSSISEQNVMERFACVDYTGIALLVATSIMTTEYTAFYCEPVSRYAYMLATFFLGVAGTILPWHPIFNRADMSWLRVGFFVSLAATGFLPIFQLSFTRSFAWAMGFYAPILKSITVYLGGAILYASKTPERWCPGMFDYFGGSHNIWHFAVLGGILFHYSAMHSFFHQAFELAQGSGCSAY